jgi:predicted aminopeptidase
MTDSQPAALDDERVAAVIFHELAHQQLYVADD